jgi:hypothetical protein
MAFAQAVAGRGVELNTLRMTTAASEGIELEACYIGGGVMLSVICKTMPQLAPIVLKNDDARTLAACIIEWTEAAADNRPEGA